MVLDLGVVADVRVVIYREQVDEDPVYQETEREAEEEGLSVQQLHDVLCCVHRICRFQDNLTGASESVAGCSVELSVLRYFLPVKYKQAIVHFQY